MFRGFSLKLTSEFLDYAKSGQKIARQNKDHIESKLSSFIDEAGDIQAEMVIAEWFPQSAFDVFISHSHKDENLALSLAGYLKEKFGLSSFIDHQAWHHCDALLKEIDNKYCYQPKAETYSYSKRNSTTAHVHNMLCIALTEVMDKSECLFFINTDNSTTKKNHISASYSKDSSTYSPWLYYEMSMLNLIKIKAPWRKRVVAKAFTRNDSIATEAFDSAPIRYRINVDDLPQLNNASIIQWYAEKRRKDQANEQVHALDILYQIHPDRR
jgi:hypothetical protein